MHDRWGVYLPPIDMHCTRSSMIELVNLTVILKCALVYIYIYSSAIPLHVAVNINIYICIHK